MLGTNFDWCLHFEQSLHTIDWPSKLFNFHFEKHDQLIPGNILSGEAAWPFVESRSLVFSRKNLVGAKFLILKQKLKNFIHPVWLVSWLRALAICPMAPCSCGMGWPLGHIAPFCCAVSFLLHSNNCSQLVKWGPSKFYWKKGLGCVHARMSHKGRCPWDSVDLNKGASETVLT